MIHPQIQTFIKVVENGSFSKAADQLFLSRVSVMRQVNTLEERIGTPLLIRDSAGIRPTPAGESLYRDAVRIRKESEEAVQQAHRLARNTRHTIRVGTSLLNPCQPLVSVWEDIKEKHPSCRLKVVPYSDEQTRILDLLSNLGKQFDLFVGVNDSASWNQLTNFLPLHNEPIQCAVPISHPLAARTTLRIQDLDGQELMMVSEGDSPNNALARSILKASCPSLRILDVGNYYDVDVFHACVERGCLLLSFPMWDSIHPSLVTIPIEWDCSAPYGIIYAKNPSPEVSDFVESIRVYLKK